MGLCETTSPAATPLATEVTEPATNPAATSDAPAAAWGTPRTSGTKSTPVLGTSETVCDATAPRLSVAISRKVWARSGAAGWRDRDR